MNDLIVILFEINSMDSMFRLTVVTSLQAVGEYNEAYTKISNNLDDYYLKWLSLGNDYYR